MKQKRAQLNRREALKMAGIGGASVLLGSAEAQASATGPKKKLSKTKPLRLVIIGGGMAGTTLAYRLSRAITWPKITVFEPLRNSAWYQPGLTMMGMGVWCEKHLEYQREAFIPKGVTWIESAVVSVDPVHQHVKDARGEETPYDYLIVASGAVLEYGEIEGLEGTLASLEMVEKKAPWMDDPCVGSVYYFHGASQLHEQFMTIVQKAVALKEGKLTILFTQQSIAVKSPAGGKSVLFGLLQKLKDAKVREKVEIIVTSGDGRLSANESYDAMYQKILKREGIVFKPFALSKVDLVSQTAYFHTGESQRYDYLHITPSMRADAMLEKSGLTNQEGWVEVEASTLQHQRFNTIFAVGDVAGTSVLKTGAAIAEQVKTVVNAIRSIDEGEKPNAVYEGYGCDTLLCIKKQQVLFEAYDKRGKPLAVVEWMNPLKGYELYWYLNSYLLKPYVMYGVMRGWA